MKIDVWSVPKHEKYNEDCWRIPDDPRESPIVLCDGASESFDSRRWALPLANGLKNTRTSPFHGCGIGSRNTKRK